MLTVIHEDSYNLVARSFNTSGQHHESGPLCEIGSKPAKVTAVAFYLCMFRDHSMYTTEPVTSSLSQYAIRMAFRKVP